MGNSKVIFGGETVIDLTEDTVTPEKLARGATAHNAAGNLIVGTATEVDIVQNKGDSTTDIMSQKAVTDLLDELSKDVANSNWFTEGTSILSNSDLNTYTTAGKYYVASTSIAGTIKNAPVTNTNYKLYVIVRTSSKSISQIIFALNNKIYIRSATSSGSLSAWETFATLDDLKDFATQGEIETLSK